MNIVLEPGASALLDALPPFHSLFCHFLLTLFCFHIRI